jgi:hypothetical protein
MSGRARAVVAGLAYAVAVFLFGSAVGTIRILALEPEFGALDATALELPLMLGLTWLVSLFVTRRCAVSPRAGDRLVMGLVALTILIATERGIGALIGRPPDFRQPAALLGLAGQIAFALFPLLQARIFARRVRARP